LKQLNPTDKAGFLGVFLGWSGAYDWHLGHKKKAIIHASLAAVSIVLLLIAGIIIQSQTTLSRLMATVGSRIQASDVLCVLGYLIAAGNIIWGTVEGIITLHRGEKSPISAKAPAVATEATSTSADTLSATTPATTTTPSAASTATTTAPAAQPVKVPMNPVTKKKIVIGVIIGASVIVLALLAWLIISLVTRIDYGDTYRTADELRSKVNTLYQDYGCSRAVDYVDSTWVSERTYNSYVADCKSAIDGSDELVQKLSETSGVKRDKKISEQFKTFEENYHRAFPEISTIGEKLDLYQKWHTFTVKVDDLTAKSSDAEFKSAADELLNSGNPTLAKYAEGWLEKTLAYIHAYQAYWNAPTDDPNKAQLRNDMNNKQSEQRAWVSENRPDVVDLVGLEFNNTSKMYNSFRTLFSTIAEAYEEHYEFGSGDCSELLGEVVICE